MPYRPLQLTEPEALRLAATARGHGAEAELASYLLIRVPVSIDEQVHYWTGWAVVTAMSTVASVAVVGIIIARHRLRISVYNHFIVGLAIPDIVFSFMCLITCSKHALAGHWYDGEGIFHGDWMCDLQSWYSLFGAAGSMWVNVLITVELYRVSSSVRRRVTYAPPTVRGVYQHLAIVYAGVGAFSWVASFGYRFFPGLPIRPAAIRGLNCLPVPYDSESEHVLTGVVFTLMAILPSAIVFGFAVVIFRPDLCAMTAAPTIRRVRALSAEDERVSPAFPQRRLQRPQLVSNSASSPPALLSRPDAEPEAPVSSKVDERTTRALMMFFSRLFIVIVVCWAPFYVCWGWQLPYYETGARVSWITAGWGHLQGFISAVIYSFKEDIYAEWQLLAAEAAAALGCGSRAADATGRRHARLSVSRLSANAARSSTSSAGVGTRYVALAEEQPADVKNTAAASSGEPSSTGQADLDASLGSTTYAAPVHGGGDLEAAMAAVAADAEANILAHELTPMLVVSWLAFQVVGEIPRHSRGVWRERKETDVVIFISHRWWSSHMQLPDDEMNTKYHLIVHGVRLLIAHHGISEEHAAIWVDYSCICQDDVDQQNLGISSLVTYAARSSYVLIPVEPTVEAMEALHTAEHPIDLIDYGERAWCRCEIYVFVCLAEVTKRSVAVFGYGDLGIGEVARVENEKHARVTDGVGSCGSSGSIGLGLARLSGSRTLRGISRRRSVITSRHGHVRGAQPGGSWWRGVLACVSSAAGDAARTLGLRVGMPTKQLKVLLTTGSRYARASPGGARGAHYSFDELPSSGEVTHESDRETIRAIEADVRRWFVHASILAEKARFDLDHSRPLLGKRGAFAFDGKQLEAQHVPLLASALLSSPHVDTLSRLSLRHNLLTGQAIDTLASSLVLNERLRALHELDLSHNVRIGSAGTAVLAAAAGHPNFRVRALRLRGCDLEPEAGGALAELVGMARLLAELDVRDNALDEEAVTLIAHAAAAVAKQTGRHTTLLVDGNPIAAHVFQLVALAQMSAAGIVPTLPASPSKEVLSASISASCSASNLSCTTACNSPRHAFETPADGASAQGSIRSAVSSLPPSPSASSKFSLPPALQPSAQHSLPPSLPPGVRRASGAERRPSIEEELPDIIVTGSVSDVRLDSLLAAVQADDLPGISAAALGAGGERGASQGWAAARRAFTVAEEPDGTHGEQHSPTAQGRRSQRPSWRTASPSASSVKAHNNIEMV